MKQQAVNKYTGFLQNSSPAVYKNIYDFVTFCLQNLTMWQIYKFTCFKIGITRPSYP